MSALPSGARLIVALAVAAGSVAPAPQAAGTSPQASAAEPSEEETGARYGELFSAHEPLYAVIGWRESTNAKFQVSFRYRFLGGRQGGEHTSWVEDLYFGFTQTSLWDIELESSPFRDTSYRPSLFYSEDRVARWSRPRRRVGMEIGIEHESNGQAGDRSRSLNIVYIRPTWTLGDPAGWHWTIAPKAWIYFGSLADNPDIASFRGWGELLVRYGRPDGLELRGTFRLGTRRDRGSAQLDVTYPLDRLRGGRIAAYAHLQVFAGWGESLIDYDIKRPTQVRVGVTVLR